MQHITESEELQTSQINGIKNAIIEADVKNAEFFDHKIVLDWLKTWGDEDEKDFPITDHTQ